MRPSVAARGLTYAEQKLLPRLPVPPLEHTMEWYLRTVKPLVSANDFEVTVNIAQDFLKGGTGTRLHQRLSARAADADCFNWLEHWWDEMYLDLRCPNPVNVNYGLWLDLPPGVSTSSAPADPQTTVAAKLVAGCLDFKGLLDREELAPEATREGPIDMNQYARLFAHARIPHRGRDVLLNYGKQPAGLPFPHFATKFLGGAPRHVAVIVDGRVFSVDVLDEGGAPLNVDDLEASFRAVRALAQAPVGADELVGVPVLTAEDRDVWADARTALETSHPGNSATLATIDSSLFVVVLEKGSPKTDEEYSESALLGGAGNRWFDKHQLIVYGNGAAGANFEHAPGDGTVALGLLSHVNSYVKDVAVSGLGSASHTQAMPFRGGGEALLGALATARLNHAALDNSFNTSVAKVDVGGARIKSHNCSPDAFAQMAMQLAAFRVYGQPVATYESNSTRKFLHGRTETVRSASSEAAAFCRDMDGGNRTRATLDLLHAAISTHQDYMKMSKDGFGVDRPLFGMKMLAMEAGDALHPLFTDPAFSLSNSWRMSTSHLGGPAKLFTFGPVVSDGFGLGYAVYPHHTQFATTAFTETSPATAADMAAAVKEAAEDMDALCVEHATG